MSSLTVVQNDPGAIILDLAWTPNNGAMDTGVTPSDTSFTVKVDGGSRGIISILWQGSPTLRFIVDGASGVTSWEVIQDQIDDELRNTDLELAYAPASISV